MIGYASDVIVPMADKPTKSAYQALEQTLNNIKTMLDWRVQSSRSSTMLPHTPTTPPRDPGCVCAA